MMLLSARLVLVFSGLALSGLAISGTVAAQYPVISIRALSQSFFSPGESYEVSVAEGSHLDEINELVCSHPGIRATILAGESDALTGESTVRHGHFKIQVSADVPPGRYEARAVGRFGISNPRSILIRNDARWNTATGRDPFHPTAIPKDVMLCQHTSPQQRDYFSLSVDAGQAYGLRIVSQAVDSPLIAVVSVLDADGRTLYRALGSEQIDASIAWVAHKSSTLTIVVNDALYRGGTAFQYGLIVSPGSPDESSELYTSLPKSISLPATDHSLSMATESPMALHVPAMIEGEFDSSDRRDLYYCDFTKDTPVRIEVVSDRIGQPSDARLILDREFTDGTGVIGWQQVATGDDSQDVSDSVVRLSSGDPVLLFEPPEDARYRISVFDLDTGRMLRDTQRYQLFVTAAQADWQLVAYNVYPHRDPKTSLPFGSNLMRGGSTVIRVFVNRNGMSLPIEVCIAGLPAGLTCHPARIAANQNQADLVITASDQVMVHRHELQIIGTIVQDQVAESRHARAACVIWEQDGSRSAPHVRLTDQLILRSTDLDVEPISVQPAGDVVVSAGKGTTVKIPIQITRRPGGAESIVLRPQGLAPGIKVAELTIDKDKTEAEWNVEVTAATVSGVYTFWGQGETKVKFALNPQSLATATVYRDKLVALRADPERAAHSTELDAAIAASDKQIEAIKKQTSEKDLTVFLATPLITLEIQ